MCTNHEKDRYVQTGNLVPGLQSARYSLPSRHCTCRRAEHTESASELCRTGTITHYRHFRSTTCGIMSANWPTGRLFASSSSLYQSGSGKGSIGAGGGFVRLRGYGTQLAVPFWAPLGGSHPVLSRAKPDGGAPGLMPGLIIGAPEKQSHSCTLAGDMIPAILSRIPRRQCGGKTWVQRHFGCHGKGPLLAAFACPVT